MTTKRDWKAYNEHLVQRGEILLDIECLKGWQDELRKMNQKKRGRKFSFSDSLILFLGTLKVAFQLGYREGEGVARSISKLTDIPVPTYSTVSRRLARLELDLSQFPSDGKPITLAVDASGLQVVRRKGWMRKKRKGFVKIHIAVEIKTKEVLALEITDDQVHESAKLQQLVASSAQQAEIDKVLADGGYDSGDCFEWLAEHQIEAGILPRKNARPGPSGARSMAQPVSRIAANGRKTWAMTSVILSKAHSHPSNLCLANVFTATIGNRCNRKSSSRSTPTTS